jgi:hypothetical protein
MTTPTATCLRHPVRRVVGEHKCENLVGYIVRQLFALVPNLAIYSFVFALDVRELVSMRATITAQRGKAIVQSSSSR